MNSEQQGVETGGACQASSGVSSDDWQALEMQLMALALQALEEGEQP